MLKGEFEIGQKVILDNDLANSNIVTVINQSPNKLFTTIEGEATATRKAQQWEVMTDRLSEIERGINITIKNENR
jgi:hypothetical protein